MRLGSAKDGAKRNAFRTFKRAFVPEGHPKIAQRFNAGTGQFCVAPVPKGRLNPSSAGRVPFRPALGRPFGTWALLTAKPSVETLGYFRMSLRDSDRRPGQGNFRKASALRTLHSALRSRS